jgi:FkbM family methyltransferase
MLGVMRRRQKIRAYLRASNARYDLPFGLLYPLAGLDVLEISRDEPAAIINYEGHPLKLYYSDSFNAQEGFNEYRQLQVEGANVLDVGAAIGDSALAFAVRGAKKVVAVEPFPFPYELLLKNISYNQLSNVIIPLNVGIGDRPSSFKVPAIKTGGDTGLIDYGEGVEVPVVTLDRLIEEQGPFEVLKMDCEGCEYRALLSSRRISELEQVQVEYHYGPEGIVEVLRRAGFKVNVTKPRRFYNTNHVNPHMLLGYICAWK